MKKYEGKTMKVEPGQVGEELASQFDELFNQGWLPTINYRGADNVLYIIWAREKEE